MRWEDDPDHLIQKLIEAGRAAQATQPDVLVFALRGKEIQTLLLESAEVCERAATQVALPENVKPIRPLGIPMPVGHSRELSKEEKSAQEDYAMRVAHEQAAVLRANAKTYRFLAAHIEEDRYFRLATNDLAFLGLMPSATVGAHYSGPAPRF